ncbi:MAG TPA: hypothetical protein VFF69_13985, partial [Phycisphaerales bacterium]|nr:hypothetical protein [Phycisphaerales bacterium]
VRSLEGRIPARLGAVNRALRGDPEAIVHKALERDPARRYQSAGELAEDVRRLLQRRPVQARRPTRTYITARFVRRNPWPVGLGLTAAAALALGTAGTLVQARQAVVARARAEARLGETRSLAHAIIFDLHDLVARLPGSTEARLALVSTAERFYGPLAADPDADGRFRLEIAEMYLRLGGIRGYTPRPSLGDSEAAIRYYSAALSILEPLRLEQPQSAPVALALSQALLRKAHIVAGPAEVEAARRAAALLQPFELSPAIAAQLVECRYRIGLALWRRWGVPPAESVDGLPDLRAAAALGEKACTLWPDHRDVVFARVEAEFWLGYVLLEMEHMAAREPLERALAHCDALFRAHAGDAAIRQRLGSVHDAMARWHARWGERGEAIAAAERAAASASDLVDADPEDYLAARSQFVWHAHAGEMYELLADRSGDAQDVRSALHHYGEYQRLLREHVARGWLSPEESRYPEEAAQAIARCQGRLASLGPDAP